MQTLLIFLLFLGPLVFFHELGHFLFARLFGVRVEVFSIGFGPKIFKKKFGETEYAASIIPLGGYVKMFGDNPLESDKLTEEERRVSFTHKSKFAKFWIVFGGPLANFILAFVIYFLLIIGGEKVPEARVGVVKKTSPYYEIGLRSGDVISKINETEILGFDDLNLIDDQINTITVTRSEEQVEMKMDSSSEDFLKELPSIIYGLRASIFTNTKGDKFYLTNSQEPKINRSLEQTIDSLNDSKVYLYKINSNLEDLKNISEMKLETSASITLDGVNTENAFKKLADNGLYPSELAVSNVVMGSPAAKAGLEKNDLIVAIQEQEVKSFSEVQKLTQTAKDDEALSYQVLRGDQVINLAISPNVEDGVARIGVQSGIVAFNTGLVETKSKGFVTSVRKALIRTKNGIVKTFMGFKKLIFGEVSIKNIGGPFAIASVAADSFSISLSMFFRLMALISINLGLINLFPIPVLDGGHIVMLGIETIYGGPLPKKALMRIQQVGLSLLFLLMFVAIFNDISRFF